jgi:hypothetical protein
VGGRDILVRDRKFSLVIRTNSIHAGTQLDHSVRHLEFYTHINITFTPFLYYIILFCI